MSLFQNYARFYDLLYGDKDYRGEAEFLTKLLRRWAPGASSLLELGCGTGRHGLCMAEAGFLVAGIDLSAEMIALARGRASASPDVLRRRLTFEQGDVRSLNLGRTFSAVASLFHVVSYLTTDAELHTGLARVRRHVERDGVFIFDFWHAPAVLAEGPQRREKIVEAEGWRIRRLTEPVWQSERDIVQVNFQVKASNALLGEAQEFEERHTMRYFYPDALAEALAKHGFVEVERGAWPTGGPVLTHTFGVYMVAKAV